MRPLAARRFGRFGRPQRRLRAGLVQLLCALAGLGLGVLLPRITLDSTVASTRVTETLVAVGFGILGLVTVIFSLLFLVVQWAFTSLSPRLTLFRDDPIVWRTFAFAVGVFVFSVTTALVIGDQQKVSVIVPAAEMAAVLAAIALIRSLQVKAFASIQLAPTLAAIAGQGRGIIDDLYPRPYTPGRRPAAPLPPRRRAVLWPHRQAILQQLDLGRLLRAVGGAVIVLRAGMGDTLQQGAPVADLHGGEVTDTAVLAGLVTGPERTFRQDPLFARSACWPTSPCGRYRPRSTTRPPPSRCWTPPRASSSSWSHATWTWPRWPMTPGISGSYWPCRPGMTTCAPPWTTSSSPQPSRPWSCCGHGPCSPPC